MAILDWMRARARWQDANQFKGTPGYHKCDSGMSRECNLQAGLSSTTRLQQLDTVDTSIIEKT